MAREKVGRPDSIKKATALTATATAALSFEESVLMAQFGRRPRVTVPDIPGPMPTGEMGGVRISRLIAGHNIVGGTAHSRNLIYVSQLIRAYFTDDKILDTYRQYQEAASTPRTSASKRASSSWPSATTRSAAASSSGSPSWSSTRRTRPTT